MAVVTSTTAFAASTPDPRNIRMGLSIPDENYCDQPYVVITKDGSWLCTLTTGRGHEGNQGQHVVSTISADKGKTWSPLVDIEPADGPEASWVMPLVTPSGRVYIFYDYNGENVRTLKDKKVRADTLGWYVFKYSDDGGRTWSKQRHRLPVRHTSMDRGNDWQGKVQLFWGIGKPIVHGKTAYFAFSKIGKHLVAKSEGWVFRSDNVLTEPDPSKIVWQMLPDGDIGIRSPEYGDVQAEHNIVTLSDGALYCMYRTTTGHPVHAYSRDGGHTWTRPVHATYTPGGRKFKTPRACPKVWKARNGKFLFWFHNNGLKDFKGRNPAWVSGGVECDGHIHWSQPEILLYDPTPNVRISYPDLIDEGGKYWVTETQKTAARVHQIDPTLFEGMWRNVEEAVKATRDGGGPKGTVAEKGLLLSLNADEVRDKTPRRMPTLPDLMGGGGFTIEFEIKLKDLASGQIVLDSRGADGAGIVVRTAEKGMVRIDMADGATKGGWNSDPGLLKPGKLHHVAVVVDGGPKIVTFIVDGVLCDGGAHRPYGWGRFPEDLGKVGRAGPLKVAPSLDGELDSLRIYGRHLRTSEVVGNYRAGRTAP